MSSSRFVKRELSRAEVRCCLELGLDRAQASQRAGMRTIWGGGFAEHGLAAVGEAEVAAWLNEQGIEAEPVCFSPDFSGKVIFWDIEAGGYKIDVKASNHISPGGKLEPGYNFLLSAYQVARGGPDIYVFVRIDKFFFSAWLCGWVLAGDVIKLGKLRKDLPRPAWELSVHDLRPMQELAEVLRDDCQ